MGVLVLSLDDREVRQGFRQMRRAGADLRPVLRQIRKPLRAELKEHAKSESGPDGAWPKRAPLDERRARKRSLKSVTKGRGRKKRTEEVRMHQLLGKMPGLTTIRQRGQKLRAVNPIPWSAAHNEGAVVGRGSVVPQREFVFMSDDFLDLADREITNYLIERGWERG